MTMERPSSVDEGLHRVATEDRRGRFARLRLSIPKALTPLRRTKTASRRDVSPGSDAASTRAICDGISPSFYRMKRVSKHLCEPSPALMQFATPANGVSFARSSSSDTISSLSETDRSPASEDTSPASCIDEGMPSMVRPGILPDVSPDKHSFEENVTFRDDGTIAKLWADYCANQTQLKSYEAVVATAAAAELLEPRAGASILTPGPVEAVDRFPLSPRERSDPFQTGMESPAIDKMFQYSSSSLESYNTKTDKAMNSTNEKAAPMQIKTNQASELGKPWKAKKSSRDSSHCDNTASRSEHNNWKDLEWHEKRRERGALASELSLWNFDDASKNRHKTPSAAYGPKWEVSTPTDLSGLAQEDDYFSQRKPTGCRLRTSVTPNLTRQEDIIEHIKDKFQAHHDEMDARANTLSYSRPCTGRPGRDFSSGEILERENNSFSSEFNRSRDMRDSITDRALSGSPRDSKVCRTTIHADLSPPLSRGVSIGLPDCSQDPMVKAAGCEKVSSRSGSGTTSKLSSRGQSFGVPGYERNRGGKAAVDEKLASRASQQQSAQAGLVKVRQSNEETLQLGGKDGRSNNDQR
ncbi:hypothetical protein CLAFUR4_14409 [Fulvia fulva]|nr:hypothetical protein CLAFUR4_14409 [Fulvia fulva]KAK4609831.1 hypothetical protein CLAFUR0_14413 [Fulvia fulva]WPV37922.1 hypothetical protein CLAFUW7_14418 [Fulvia fulva]